ncbi:uncharacterized protein RJT21DRAFT_4449 [Scheffersomyces amazonensis]|uniref:uncharacterized protein n=1 Tax=Scheffersomyces amazonensis TaxID=1078765 RepID=UPI00315D8A0A
MADFFHGISISSLIGILIVKLTTSSFTLSVKDIWSFASGLKMIIICYGVIFPHPKIAKHTSYSFLILAYSLSNFIHFSYFAFKVKTKTSPRFLFWLEYSNFYLTYPMALISEMILLFLSLQFIPDESIHELFTKFVILAYIPVAYIVWGYLKNRKQVKYTQVIEKRDRARQAAQNVNVPAKAVGSTAIPSIPEEVELRTLN